MAPYRPERRNRSGRTQVDHDIFEGLPIRQWRLSESVVAPHEPLEQSQNKNAWPELPMPKDAHMYADHSQQLLRAARAGKLYKPPSGNDDEKENPEEEEDIREIQKGFIAYKYTRVPRHLEDSEPFEHLAKRRKGLPSINSGPAGALGSLEVQGNMRETKVKKIDAEGNVVVWPVLVPEGQTIEGEVKETDVEAAPVTAAATPGTVVEGVGIVNAEGVVVATELPQPTPPRRRPPPPKRKSKKGPGRGRKKVVFADGEGPAAGTVGSAGAVEGGAESARDSKGGGISAPSDTDTPMADAQEGGDDEEGEEGEEGEDGDEDEDREEGELSPSPASAKVGTEKAQEDQTREVPPTAAGEMPISSAGNQGTQAPPESLPGSSNHPSTAEGAVKEQNSADANSSANAHAPADEVHFSDGEPDLLGSLERHLEQEGKKNAK